MRLERILVFESACFLRVDTSRLMIDRQDESTKTVALVDIAAIIIESPQVVITAAALQGLAGSDIAVLIADRKHQPASILFPVGEHVATVARQREQALMPQTLADSLWQKLVSAKISNQGALLEFAQKPKALARLRRLSESVAPGDPQNCEAQAAQVYWPALFDIEFRREKEGAQEHVNKCLNYGYTIVRSLIARYVALSGLNGIFGIGHSNQTNSLALVDDLIEPFRASVDALVWADLQDMEWGSEAKKTILKILQVPVRLDGKEYRLSAAAAESVNSYVRCVSSRSEKFLLTPKWMNPHTRTDF
jgi:CRISP-associated protein Cas1